ncbi:MAG: AAA family ATPase [Lentisphaerae bacterium]|nr:AAA family ATPase [Lentisphaerota bacterium]
MKLAITGKGGVGKTTVVAFLADALHKAGYTVIAIDADPDSNLVACLGYPNPEKIRPLVELHDLVHERTGVKPGTTGGLFRLNPKVDDLPAKYSVNVNGVRVLVAGAVRKGGSGCYCPENALVRALIAHLLLEKNTALVLDMEAGVEHLGRGTIKAVNRLLIVVEPAPRSIETAARIKKMAADIGLKWVAVIGNRVRSQHDREYLLRSLTGFDFAGFIPYDEALPQAEIAGKSVVTASAAVRDAASAIVDYLKKPSPN